MYTYEFLQKEPQFHAFKETPTSFCYTFQQTEDETDKNVVFNLIIPKYFIKRAAIQYEYYEVLSDGQLLYGFQHYKPEWFAKIEKKAKIMFARKNKIRSLFVEKRPIHDLLKESLTTPEGVRTYERFCQEGIIQTNDEYVFYHILSILEFEDIDVVTYIGQNRYFYEIHLTD